MPAPAPLRSRTGASLTGFIVRLSTRDVPAKLNVSDLFSIVRRYIEIIYVPNDSLNPGGSSIAVKGNQEISAATSPREGSDGDATYADAVSDDRHAIRKTKSILRQQAADSQRLTIEISGRSDCCIGGDPSPRFTFSVCCDAVYADSDRIEIKPVTIAILPPKSRLASPWRRRIDIDTPIDKCGSF